MVDGIGLGKNNLGDGDKGIAVLKETFQNGGESLWGVLCGVMKQDDGAGADLGGDPLGDLVGGDVLPVQTVHVPLDRLHADGADGVDGMVVVVAVGQADQSGADAGDRFDLIVAGVQIGYHLVGGQLGVVGVGIGVVHHLMARIVEGLDGFGVFLHPLAYHEEGGFDLVSAQNVDQLLSVFIAPG